MEITPKTKIIMETICAIAAICVALVVVCLLAIWLTKENEDAKASSDKQLTAKSDDEAKEEALNNFFFYQPYMDGCGMWHDGFYPYNPL